MFLRVLTFAICYLEFFQVVDSVQCDANTCKKRCQSSKPGDSNTTMIISVSSSVGLLIVVVIAFGTVLCIRSRRLQKRVLQSKMDIRPTSSILNEYSGGRSLPPVPPGKHLFEDPNIYEEIDYYELDKKMGGKDNPYTVASDEPTSSNYYLTPYSLNKPNNPPPASPLLLHDFKDD